MQLTVAGPWFADAHRRRVLLRGVNLGGSTKVPAVPDGATHLPTDFAGHREVSFVGRPFPLDEADAHYRRLRGWGFNLLRFLTTWEAVEHAGPGDYDEAYLDYLRAVVQKAGDHGFAVFVDPHQDVWSRMTGGDGAPGWTLELLGFDLPRLDASEAAITMQGRIRLGDRSPYPYGQMIWPNNRYRLAAATMFTLFFAGERLAPGCTVAGEKVQHLLQRHFVGAMRAVAERLAGMDHVLGYDSLNEPAAGYVGIADLREPLPVYHSAPRLTGFESLTIPAGFPARVPRVERRGLRQEVAGEVLLNPEAISAWRDPAADVWRREGVWEADAAGRPHLLRPTHFAGVRFFADCVVPFVKRYAAALRAVDPGAILFIEGEPEAEEPLRWDDPESPVVNASHWYDLLTLTTKHYDPEACLVWGSGEVVEGAELVRASFRAQIAAHVADSRRYLGGAPTLIGEFGLPYDLDGGAAYRTGDFSEHVAALDAYYEALDANLVHSAQWNYTADNDNAHGDRWNGEDLSIYSREQGGRAVPGFCRPTLRAAAGIPQGQRFDRMSGTFTLVVEVDGAVSAPTLVYLPRLHYPGGPAVAVTSGSAAYDEAAQLLTWRGAAPGRQVLIVRRGEPSTNKTRIHE